MQAIITTYRPGGARGARISAKCAAGSCSIPYPHELHDDDKHRAAAAALQAKMAKLGGEHWLAPMVGGCLPTGQWAFVFTGA